MNDHHDALGRLAAFLDLRFHEPSALDARERIAAFVHEHFGEA